MNTLSLNFLKNDDYNQFTESMYKKISSLSFKDYKKYATLVHNQQNYKFTCNKISCFKYDFLDSNLNLLCEEKYKNDYFSHIIFQDNSILIDFINFEDLFNNLLNIKTRYYPIINMIHLPCSNTGHCTIFILDKHTTKVYLLDSNDDVINYYAKYFEDNELTRFHFHNSIKNLFSLCGFDYVPNLELGISKSINYKNNEINQKNFFKGYCMAYSFLFVDLFLYEENQNLEYKDIVKKIYNLTNYERNEMINRYHSYFYNILECLK